MTNRIFLSPPHVTAIEEEALIRAFRSGWIAPLGPEVDAFENELASHTGRKYAVALSSGTAALHLGLITLGVGPGDYVLTSTLTFAATTNAILYTGAQPIFVDSDETGNMNPELLDDACAALERIDIRPKVILPVDMLGKIAAYEQINRTAARYAIPALADAAESLGAIRHGAPAGSFGHAAAVSFNGNKIMTTSGGGALLTDNPDQAERVRYLATQARQPVVHYEHTEVGYNYRLSNLLAALGRAQLTRLEDMIERRRQIRAEYKALFETIRGATLFGEPSGLDDPHTRDNFWLSSISIDTEASNTSPEQLRQFLAARDIESRPIWKPMHLQPAFSHFRAFLDHSSERQYRTGLSLPSGSVLTSSSLNYVKAALRDAFEAAQGSPKVGLS